MKFILAEIYYFIVLASFLFSTVFSEGTQCGQPGRPVNGTVSPSGKTYFPGEKVTYTCLEGFVLFGQEGRTCLKNGTWSGKVPLCDFNIAKGKRSIQSATLWSYVPGLALDGNKDTCSFTPKGPDSRWWQVHLGRKYNVVKIGVTISPGSFQEFTIYVIELLSNNKALYKPCVEFKGVFQTHKGLFKCNDGLGHPGQYVYIRDDRQDPEYFGLCEVEVFAYRELIPCGEPEIPINGVVKRESEERAAYSCDTGHNLGGGDPVLTCSSKGDWQGQIPKCNKVRCPPLPHLDNGFIEIGTPRGEYAFGTKATYSCSPGYVLRGPAIRECGQEGEWLGETPTCQGVSCGEPPHFENSKYTYLNDTSSHVTEIVVYTCLDGFKRHPKSEDAFSTCLPSGSWRSINVTCIPIADKLDYVLRESEGKTLDFIVPPTSKESNTPGLVITLAVIAGILALGMVIFGILLLRRKFLTSFGSLNPLVGGSFDSGDGNKKTKSKESVNSVEAGSIPYAETIISKSSSIFNTNILQGITNRDYKSRFNYVNRTEDNGSSGESSSGLDPPYEQVKSEHSYETLKKKSLSKFSGEDNQSSQDANYESVSGDKESIGYETVSNPKEPGYEIIANPKDTGYETVAGAREPGYEVVAENKEHGYELIKRRDTSNKEPGYETVGGETVEPSYEVVKNDSRTIHGYETLKPKVPPRSKEGEGNVPDILLNIAENQKVTQTSEPQRESHTDSKSPSSQVPVEILALYAKVDKTKKSKKPKSKGNGNYNTIEGQIPEYSLESKTLDSHPKHKLKDFTKFNTLSQIDCNSKSGSPPSSLSTEGNNSLSSGGSLIRPLPPLPT